MIELTARATWERVAEDLSNVAIGDTVRCISRSLSQRDLEGVVTMLEPPYTVGVDYTDSGWKGGHGCTDFNAVPPVNTSKSGLSGWKHNPTELEVLV